MFKTSNLYKTLSTLIECCHNILISGAPGIGKSEIVYRLCKEKKLSIYEVRLYEQGEAAIGFPRIDVGVTTFTKPFWFEKVEKERPDVVLFDDFHLVENYIQRYFYRFLTSRVIHEFGLSYKPKLIVAGNFNIDTASSCELQSPVSTRFDVMIAYEPELDSFIEWALESGRIDKRLIAFIKANPDLFYTDDPPTTSMYPCPRTWEKLSQIIKSTNDISVAPGVVGEEAGYKLIDFWPLLDLTTEEILNLDSEELNPAMTVAACYILASEVGPKIVANYFDEITKKTIGWVNYFEPDIVILFCKMCVEPFRKVGNYETAKKAFFENLKKFCGCTKMDPEKAKNTVYGKVLSMAAVFVEGPGEKAEATYRLALKQRSKRRMR